MITSEAGFIIATPTKCGTTTMEAVARRHMRNAGADGDLFRIMDWDRPRRQHRMCLPPDVTDETDRGGRTGLAEPTGMGEWGDATRYLFVRNPYTRYMSIYTYLKAPANYSQWGARQVQGNQWAGHDSAKRLKREPMSFETFLFWLVDQRKSAMNAGMTMRRGDLRFGKAYRSPWVWTDSLSFALNTLRSQPGGWALKDEDVLFLHLESIWGDLAGLDSAWGLGLDLSPVHANRSTAYGVKGADPGSPEFWGGIKCARRAFRDRVFDSNWVQEHTREADECSCAACAIGVFSEAQAVGYVGLG